MQGEDVPVLRLHLPLLEGVPRFGHLLLQTPAAIGVVDVAAQEERRAVPEAKDVPEKKSGEGKC